MPATPYSDFDLQLIAGKWRHGSSALRFTDTDPYGGGQLVEGPWATVGDLGAAYAGAEEAQRDWCRATSAERSAVFLRAAEIIDIHMDELVDWLIKEAGTTRMRALVEIGIVRATTMAAVTHTSLPHRTVPSDVPGKANRIYTKPAGVEARRAMRETLARSGAGWVEGSRHHAKTSMHHTRVEDALKQSFLFSHAVP